MREKLVMIILLLIFIVSGCSGVNSVPEQIKLRKCHQMILMMCKTKRHY